MKKEELHREMEHIEVELKRRKRFLRKRLTKKK